MLAANGLIAGIEVAFEIESHDEIFL